MSRDNGSLATLEELKAKARATDVEMSTRICLDMSHFKAVMKHLRKVDDNIILRMNTTNTAAEGECMAVFQILQTAYRRRERDISLCLGVLDQKIEETKMNDRKNGGSGRSKLFSLETQRDWIANERGVEDIVRKRSLDVFRSRCQFFEFPKEFEDFLNQREK
ncbi:hypothetical protein IW140_004425 [Coemansia sp. RSA 1813]|nr:hypothetical protein EV178_006125 [Coemansia sp. RSA 1646]KAJ1765088.1 hypothetical protein LPJ74_006484 [Coemansia sp. RSA 1843]KAJ2087756.1 hypothetical protein IW138_004726 [Coemansia sp. RSA 986]KAJ2210645.1 hypothetical protein EV179_006093 [Coemansia sp. RSA 487]KAJ2567517.1 hypothetical protein IW140_004425 [Coemansia sp. RSA 1813]